MGNTSSNSEEQLQQQSSNISTTSGKMDVNFEAHTRTLLQDSSQVQAVQLDTEANNYVWSIDGFLTDEECDRLIELTEQVRYGDAPVTVGQNSYVMATDIRNNERVIWDDEETAKLLWERVKRFVPENHTDLHNVARSARNNQEKGEDEPMKACGVNERFRFYKYTSGQYFKPHYDGCFARKTVYDEQLNANVQERSYLTLMFYLSDVQRGGETFFYHDSWSRRMRNNDTQDENGESCRFAVKPKKGTALLFVHSQLHAGADMPMDSTETKYVMRSDVMFRRIVPVPVPVVTATTQEEEEEAMPQKPLEEQEPEDME